MRLLSAPADLLLTLALALGPGPLSAQAPPPPAEAPAPAAPAAGAGQLLVAPSRVVLDMHKRTAELNLSNTGFAAGTYRIALVRMEMNEDGGIAEQPFDTAPGAVNLQGLIRFSPREVVLGPQESQTVRLQMRKPADLPEGEYRLYLQFRGLPPAPEPPEPGQAGVKKGLSIRLLPVYCLAVPVILRHGQTAAKVALSDLAYDAAHHTLRLRMNRAGNQSVYGDLQATWIPRAGAPVPVAETTGIAVYVPNAFRKTAMPLELPKGLAALSSGRLKVTYRLPPAEGGALLAESFLDVP
jgi:P pilus assembly chaperone PapD